MLSLFVFVVFSCQKELKFDPDGPAQGTLKKDASGDCLPSTISGIYQKDTALNSTNFIDVQVNVTVAGTWDIKSDSLNGMIFKGTGKFNDKGINTVRLYGTGKPVASGFITFTISFNNSSCKLSVNVVGAGVSAAVYTLSGAPGTCLNTNVNGVYKVGVALSFSNTISVEVNVTTAGTYTFGAAGVNGMLFTANGLFVTTGLQTVILNGAGVPLTIGPSITTASNGASSSCTFTINVLPNTPPNTDYFPTTANSWWHYNSDFTSPDSLYKNSTTTQTVAGNVYRKFTVGRIAAAIQDDSTFYRKAGTSYFHYISLDTFASNYFVTPQFGEINFLDEAATLNVPWTTAEYTGTTNIGSILVPILVPLKIKYQFTLTGQNITRVVNGVTYTNVHEITWKAMENINNLGYVDNVLYKSYYAKGIGLIEYQQDYVATPGIEDTELLKSYLVF